VSTAAEVASAGEVVDGSADRRFYRRLGWTLVVGELVGYSVEDRFCRWLALILATFGMLWLCAVGYGISLLFG
jgi:hypothetical protein